MVRIFLSLVAIGIALVAPNRLAWAEDCVSSPDPMSQQAELRQIFDSVCEVKFNADACTEYWQRELARFKDPKEKSEWVKKLRSCYQNTDRGAVNEILTGTARTIRGFKNGVVEFDKELALGIPKAIYSRLSSAAECKRDVESKRKTLDAYNAFMSAAEQLKVDEEDLRSDSCPDFEQRLKSHTQKVQNDRIITSIRTRDRSGLKQPLPRSPSSDSGPGIWTAVETAMKGLGLKKECYSPGAWAELSGEMAAYFAGTILAGGMATSKIAGTDRLARVAGKTDEELRKYVSELKSMGKEERIARANARLQGAGGELTMEQRIEGLERSLGHTLSPTQRKGLEEAHKIGGKKGYGEYTPEEIALKDQKLREHGFDNPYWRRIAIYEGWAGSMPGRVRVVVGLSSPAELAVGARKSLLEAESLVDKSGISRGVANDVVAQRKFLQAAEGLEKDLPQYAKLDDPRLTQIKRAMRPDIEVHIINGTEPVENVLGQVEALSRFERIVGMEQWKFEEVALSYVRAGKPEEARRVMSRSPVYSNLSSATSQENYWQRFLRQMAQVH